MFCSPTLTRIAVAIFLVTPLSHALEQGATVIEETFEERNTPRLWKASEHGSHRIIRVGDGNVLQIDNEKGSAAAIFPLPAEALRGMKLRVEARVKAENVSLPPKPWNGIKLMLHTSSPAEEEYPQATIDVGTFDWTKATFSASIPRDATAMELVIGLEESSGSVWFDDVKVMVEEIPRQPPAKLGPVYKGHDLPRLRGAMIPTRATPQDLRDLAALGANHVRWQLTWDSFPTSPADTASVQQYEDWLEKTLAHVDTLLPLCHELGLRVLIDLHTPPGGVTPRQAMRMFTEKQFQASLVESWERIARRYKDSPAIWGYDLLNEPMEGIVAPGLSTWRELAEEAARRIRTIDPDRTIVVEAAPGGSAIALAEFTPLPVPNIVYSFHFYEPHAFTHQKVYDTFPLSLTYPGEIQGRLWNKESLRHIMQKVAGWQREHQVHIYVGEFSAIRWAPGDSALAYVRDCIELFEEFGWDWAYHAFREWHGWSIEHGSEKQNIEPEPVPGSRHRLMTEWFGKNEKPK